jgi:probable F420-dependent oxidoreductase
MAVISVQASPSDADSWLDLARRCEAAGFDALLAADHPGSAPSPFVALAAAAAVTSRIGLGSYVSNAAVRDPILLAADVATLDLVSAGRARLGLGAGHTPAEWNAVGRTRPDVAGRVRRCLEVAEAVQALLAGEQVDVDSPDLAVRDARLQAPRPLQERIPLTIGAANSRLLRWAGAHADVVGLSGFGRTLPDGHSHEVRWRADQLEAQLQHVTDGAAGRSQPPQLEALVQLVAVTDDAGAVLAGVAQHTGLSEADLVAAPFVLVGTEDEIVSAIAGHEHRWGITRFVVREAALEPVAALTRRVRPSTWTARA